VAIITSSSSINRDRIAALKKQKKLTREVEAALEAKKQAEAAEKNTISAHRIATKLARINGSEPPAPLQAKEPAVEPEPVVEQELKAESEAPAPKKPAKRTYKKRTKK
jgi:hypothetical protein|tara:strand:+ start:634 stop:957 length:324 start_codon:yes stop_codon:yes gene_type:complete